ncbi:MAG TPA: hypothetical protein EYN15_01395, partial [Chromatiales bacterium]|nr:hypothetical protein [Chromatiales bacterium]
MSRRRVTAKREILPDPKHGSVMLAKFVNMMMVDGKKSVTERIVYTALDEVKERASTDVPVESLEKALENISPMAGCRHDSIHSACCHNKYGAAYLA